MNQNDHYRSIHRSPAIGRVSSGKHGTSSDTVLSKMVNSRGRGGLAGGYYNSEAIMDITAERTANNIDDYENILKTQPELELPIQILIASILSPKNANKILLKHGVKKNPLPAELVNRLIQSAKNCTENVYNIKTMLAKKLRKALFEVGADVTLIMSEAAIDDVINGRIADLHGKMATEGLQTKVIADAVADATRNIGRFGNAVANQDMGLESMFSQHASPTIDAPAGELKMVCTGWEKIKNFKEPIYCDNPKLLGLGMALENLVEKKKAAINNNSGIRNYEQLDKLYHDVPGGIQEMVVLPRPNETSRKSVNRPILREVPPECCMPVFQAGAPSKHSGYLFLIDEFGGFASRNLRRDYWRNVSEVVGGNREAVSGVLDRAAKAMSTDTENDTMLAMAAQQSFRELAIKDIERKFLNSTMGNVSVGELESFFNLMFERAMCGRQTRVLYVPNDMVVYWAYRYNENGTGRSLLEDNKFLASMRSLILISNTETQLRNSIDYVKLGVVFDPNDPNKNRTKELIVDQFARNRLRSTPWNMTNPRRIIEHMQMSGVSFDFDGGSDYPGTKINIDRQDIQQRAVDMELDEVAFRRLMMGFGLAPEIVDLSMNIEFSSKIVTSNELSLKRVMVTQDITNYFIRQFSVKAMLSDPIQMEEMSNIVKEWVTTLEGDDWTDEKKAALDVNRIINIFLGAYEPTLPRPESSLAADIEEFDTYMGGVEKVIDTAINEDAIGSLDNSMLNEQVGRFKAIYKQYHAIKWMVEHDFMTEVLEDMKLTPNAELPEIITSSISHYRSVNGMIKALLPRLVSQNIVDSEQLQTIMENLDQFRDKTESNMSAPSGGSDDVSSSDEDVPSGDDPDGAGGDPFVDDPFSDQPPETNDEPETPEEPTEASADATKEDGPEEAGGNDPKE